MRNLILKALDFVAVALVVLATLGGLVMGLGIASQPYAPTLVRVLAPVLGIALGFVSGVLVSGGILALTEIAKNTRRTVELLERASPR